MPSIAYAALKQLLEYKNVVYRAGWNLRQGIGVGIEA